MADEMEKRMDKLESHLDKLDGIVTQHLIESGEIRTTLAKVDKALETMKDVPADNKWLKKFMWFVLSSPLVVEAAKHIHLAGK